MQSDIGSTQTLFVAETNFKGSNLPDCITKSSWQLKSDQDKGPAIADPLSPTYGMRNQCTTTRRNVNIIYAVPIQIRGWLIQSWGTPIQYLRMSIQFLKIAGVPHRRPHWQSGGDSPDRCLGCPRFRFTDLRCKLLAIRFLVKRRLRSAVNSGSTCNSAWAVGEERGDDDCNI